nr:MAG: putative capsid protein [Narnaviridae sp.]
MTSKRNARSSGPKRRAGKAPQQARMRGRGDYTSDVLDEADYARRLEKKIDHLERSLVHATPSISKGAGLAGRALGTMLGQGDLGAMAGESLAKLFGYGDYSTRLKGNSLMAGVSGNAVPKFQGDGKRGVRLMEREFLGNIQAGSLVSGSTVFTNQAFELNPTSTSTFPWLSKIAPLFDQWEPHGIVFEFHTTSSTYNGSSQALGAVIMATDYDPLDPLYTSKQQMENADYSCSSVPSTNLLHGVECDPHERPIEVLYTSSRPTNPQFSSLGNFQIATQGMSVADVVLGELWVSYDITFYKKQIAGTVADLPYIAGSGFVVNGNPLVDFSASLSSSQMTYSLLPGIGTDIFFPPNLDSGTFEYVLTDDNYQTGDTSGTSATNCTVVYLDSSAPLSAGAKLIQRAFITITAPNAKIRLGLKAVASANTRFTLVQVPTGASA